MEIETEAGKGRGDERSRENTKVIKETVIETWTQSGLIFLSVYRIGQKHIFTQFSTRYDSLVFCKKRYRIILKGLG
nr:hypothetical protein CFP56_47768 [Quercus suber]